MDETAGRLDDPLAGWLASWLAQEIAFQICIVICLNKNQSAAYLQALSLSLVASQIYAVSS